jgi:hypothetical protein
MFPLSPDARDRGHPATFFGDESCRPSRKAEVLHGFHRGFFEIADVDVRTTAGLETGATFTPGCEPKDRERLFSSNPSGAGRLRCDSGSREVGGLEIMPKKCAKLYSSGLWAGANLCQHAA